MESQREYQHWRDQKLAALGQHPPNTVSVGDPINPQTSELQALQTACMHHNFAIFRFEVVPARPEQALIALGKQLGLTRLDRNLCAEDSGLSALTVDYGGAGKRYIPYTDRPLSWHTDGYYNDLERQVRAWLLYCAQDAAEGGENALLDHEIAYIRLRDHDPDLVDALMVADAFTVPANEEEGMELRGARTGPVFSWMPENDRLHMRYSARQRHIIWKADDAVQAAAAFLLRLFKDGDDHIFSYRLAPGEGMISNNVLHRRTAFTDDPDSGRKRLVYRARYFDRVVGT